MVKAINRYEVEYDETGENVSTFDLPFACRVVQVSGFTSGPNAVTFWVEFNTEETVTEQRTFQVFPSEGIVAEFSSYSGTALLGSTVVHLYEIYGYVAEESDALPL